MNGRVRTDERIFGPPSTFRPLKVYAFDPSLGRRFGNLLPVEVPYEKLEAGPKGKLVHVVDLDLSNGCYYPPVDLDGADVLIGGGLSPTESTPKFHQQMVYAVAQRTIDRFGVALGRRFSWSRRRKDAAGNPRPLRILPHAFQDANAYYDPELHALLFGYFQASSTNAGDNLPGQIVYTCLSHDIVAHETAHALLHETRPYYLEPTGCDAAAFHEAFSDMVALFQHFGIDAAVKEALDRTGGVLHRAELVPTTQGSAEPMITADFAGKNILLGLAQQFGEAMGMRSALRGALGSKRDPAVLAKAIEPHERGAVLLAAVFDAFFTVYSHRMADLLRIANGGVRATNVELSTDLVNRLAKEVSKTALHFLSMCIRALDYCPPVDITFGDFLRALVTADDELVPQDPYGYRPILIEAFRARGIRPGSEVTSYSEEALRWSRPRSGPGGALRCKGLGFDLIYGNDPKEQSRNAQLLSTFGAANRAALHLHPKVPVQAWGFHPVHRVGPDGHLRFEAVVQLLQTVNEPIVPGSKTAGTWKRRGGTTLVVDLPSGEVRFAIYKRLASRRRHEAERDFRLDGGGMYLETYDDGVDFPRTSLAKLHRGY